MVERPQRAQVVCAIVAAVAPVSSVSPVSLVCRVILVGLCGTLRSPTAPSRMAENIRGASGLRCGGLATAATILARSGRGGGRGGASESPDFLRPPSTPRPRPTRSFRPGDRRSRPIPVPLRVEGAVTGVFVSKVTRE